MSTDRLPPVEQETMTWGMRIGLSLICLIIFGGIVLLSQRPVSTAEGGQVDDGRTRDAGLLNDSGDSDSDDESPDIGGEGHGEP